MMALTPGTTLGPYEIQTPLGAGGMGEVYTARDTRLDRTVAIKVLPEHVASDPDLKQRFEREAKTVAALSHPHICPVFDVGSQDGIDFLVMEYLEGETLAQRLEKGALPLDQALQIAIQIADALDKAHRQGIVHRDLKPGNIMLTKSGAKLLDFGLAKLRKPGTVGAAGFSAAPTQREPLTGEGAILGTLQYMAPEQLEAKDADARTDIFAFGTTVYEMVTGQKAFKGDSQASLIHSIMGVDPPAMSSLHVVSPPALDRVAKRCLAKDPDDRWQSARDLTDELQWIREGGSQPSVSALVTTPEPARWRRTVGVAVAASMVVAVITGVAVWSLMRSALEPLARVLISGGGADPLYIAPSTADVAISPDGQHVAYVAGNRRAPQIQVRALGQLVPTTVVAEGLPFSPFFSPDGEWLGFFDVSDRVLRRVSVHGGPPAEICELPGRFQMRGATWGADDTIVFGTYTPDSGLWRVHAGGGEPVQLTTPDDQGNHVWPEMLPSGEAVLFTMVPGTGVDNAQLAVLTLEESAPKLINLGGTHPRYVPTGHLVYSVDNTLREVVEVRADLAGRAPAAQLPQGRPSSRSAGRCGPTAPRPAHRRDPRLVPADTDREPAPSSRWSGHTA